MDVNKSHDDNNGGGQRENVESAFDKSQADMSRKCVPEKKVMNCSVAKKSVKRVC